ncbi:putative ring finger protein [Diplodia seriata]|uniref:Putative ring finger protein n=1 Tax=Diplodia seriata TaxID=420778 RepID=A0A0G2EGL9_9PEZI|nr:putative ring finger protein [Diplodia seriata]
MSGSTPPSPAAPPNTASSTPSSTRPGTPFDLTPFAHPFDLFEEPPPPPANPHPHTHQPHAVPAIFRRRNAIPHLPMDPPTGPPIPDPPAPAHAPAPFLSPLNPLHRTRLITNALTPALPRPDDPTCPICLDPYGKDADTAALPCRHVFDRECVSEWLREPGRNTCPVCRYEVWPEEESEDEEEEGDVPPLVFVPNVPVATLGAAARAAVRDALRGGLGGAAGGGGNAAGAGPGGVVVGVVGPAVVGGDEDADDLDSVDFDHDAQPMGDAPLGLWIGDFPPGEGPVVHAEGGAEIDEDEEREIDNIVNQALLEAQGPLNVDGAEFDEDEEREIDNIVNQALMAQGPLNMNGGNNGLPVVVYPNMRIPSSAWRQVHWMPAERRLSVRAALHRARYGPSPREAVFAEAARLRARDDILAAEGSVEMVLVDISRMILSLMGDHNLQIRSRRIQDVINAMLRQATYLDGHEAIGGAMFNMMLRTARREILRQRHERAGFRGRVRHWFGVRPVREITDVPEDYENDEMLADGLDVAAEMARRMINSLRVVRLATTGVAAAAGNQA